MPTCPRPVFRDRQRGLRAQENGDCKEQTLSPVVDAALNRKESVMRNDLALSACVAALLAGSAMAQTEATPPATDTTTTQQTEGQSTQPEAQTDATQSATSAEPAATASDPAASSDAATPPAADAGAAAAGGDPRQALIAAAERLREEVNAMAGESGSESGSGTDATAEGGDAAQTQPLAPEAQQRVTTALDEFDQAVQQYGAGENSEQSKQMVTQLQTQSQQVREQLQSDPQAAMQGLNQLTEAAMALPQSEISSEARNLQGRTIVSSDGEEAGEITGMLVTAEGKVEAVIIGSSGALGIGGDQHVVSWEIGRAHV